MPLFNYKCQVCNKEFEELVRSSEEKVVCPECNSDKVLKQLPNRICGSTKAGGHSGGGNNGFT